MEQYTCVTPELFAAMRERASVILKDHRDGIDPLILSHLDTLNTHPNIVTNYSCSGHPNDKDPKRRRYRDATYFLCAVDSLEGLKYLLEVQRRWTEKLQAIELHQWSAIRVSHVTRAWPDGDGEPIYYPAISLSGRVSMSENKQQRILQLLEEACDEALIQLEAKQ